MYQAIFARSSFDLRALQIFELHHKKFALPREPASIPSIFNHGNLCLSISAENISTSAPKYLSKNKYHIKNLSCDICGLLFQGLIHISRSFSRRDLIIKESFYVKKSEVDPIKGFSGVWGLMGVGCISSKRRIRLLLHFHKLF